MSQSIVTLDNSTDYTDTYERVLVEKKGNKNLVFHEKFRTKYFTNPEQLNHVIHDLVVNKGFVMNKSNKDLIEFTHSLSNTTYTIYHEKLAGSYVEKVLVGELD
tara:strand:- start:244 stop:555 length:312 start_codon:yes stop_codon:yes gene_type:complete